MELMDAMCRGSELAAVVVRICASKSSNVCCLSRASYGYILVQRQSPANGGNNGLRNGEPTMNVCIAVRFGESPIV